MLVLSRKVGQSLVIAEGVTVTVSEIGPDFVRLTVEAPNEADVRRRYPQALDVPDDGSTAGGRHDRPVVVTLTLHEGALLDRLRRRMSSDEAPPPARDAALGAILQAVAEADDFELPLLNAPEPPPKALPTATPRRRPATTGVKPR